MMTDPDIHHFVSKSWPVLDASSQEFVVLNAAIPACLRAQLLLGCYRDNEVDLSHPLTAKLNAMRDQGTSITPIKIGESIPADTYRTKSRGYHASHHSDPTWAFSSL